MGLFTNRAQVWGFAAPDLARSYSSRYLHPDSSINSVIVRPAFGRDYYGIEAVRRSNHQWLSPWEATLPPGSDERLPNLEGYRRNSEKHMRDKTGLFMVIEADQEISGIVSIGGVQHGAMSQGTLGYWIAQRCAGQGVTSLAVASVIDTVLGPLNLHRLEINVRPENGPSLGLCRKLRLRYEGLKPRFMSIGGRWSDHVGFAIDQEMLPSGGLVEEIFGDGRR